MALKMALVLLLNLFDFRSPVQEPAPQRVQAPQVLEPETAHLSPVVEPRQERLVEPAIVTPTAEIAERLQQLEEPSEVPQIQEARAVVEIPRTPGILKNFRGKL